MQDIWRGPEDAVYTTYKAVVHKRILKLCSYCKQMLRVEVISYT